MKAESIDALLEMELKDIYSAENQILKALPRMARAAASPALKAAFTEHARQTEGQVARLERAAEALGVRLRGKKCVAMEGLIEEGKEILEEMEEKGPLRDAALIGAAQKVEHYEIAAYGTARTLAEVLGHGEVVQLLQQTLDEESETDEKLTALSVGEILPAAAQGADA